MAKHRRIGIQFPLAGLNKRGAYRQQPPFSTPDALNVRSIDTEEGRERGGSRSGLIQSHADDLGGSIRMLSPMILALGDDFTVWSDTFSGTSMAAVWAIPSWATAMPSILPNALASVSYAVSEGEAVRDALTIDTAQAYSVDLWLTPWSGAYHGKYRIYLRLDNTTPAIGTAGVMIELIATGSAGAYTATLDSYVASVKTTIDTASGTITTRPGWLTATVSGTTVTVYWCGTEIMSGTVGAHTGSRVGFGMECTVSGGVCLANVFRVQYYSTGSVPSTRSVLVGSASGNLFKESTYGRISQVSTNLTLRDDVPLMAAQSGQDLYIADYGDLRVTGTDGVISGATLDAASVADWTALSIDAHDDVVVVSAVTGSTVAGTYKIQSIASGALTLTASPGNGTCAYRIERAPKIYDPSAATLNILTATTGQVPTGCPLICRFNDRIFLAGAEIAPHVWYASRRGTETDWDYSQTDSERAVAGSTPPAGVPGEAITALIPHSDDYLIIGCLNSLWRLTGDPAYGGGLPNVSQTVGIIGPKAWCLGPTGELIFLSLSGLYALSPGGNSYPIPLSQEILPREFLNIDPNVTTVLLEYDIQAREVQIYLTSESYNSRYHWKFNWDRKTFWPVTLASDNEPTMTCPVQATTVEDSCIILGCRDGKLRRFSELAENDCGTAFTSYVVIGPIALAADSQVGRIISIDVDMAEDSGDVTLALRPSLTFEGSVGASNSYTCTLVDGINATIHPDCRGQAFTMKLTGSASRKWAVENITAVIAEAGRRRIY